MDFNPPCALPDPIRRKFGTEIEAGNILMVAGAERASLQAAGFAIANEGTELLPFQSYKAMA